MTHKVNHLRVASYNIRKSKGLDQRRDPRRILAVLNGLDADIVALQEADFRLRDRPSALCSELIRTETDFDVVPTAKNDVSLGWHGNAILIRKDIARGPVTRIDLPGLEPRGAVQLDLTATAGVRIVATHLGLTRRHRLRQLDAIAAAVGDEDNAVILGDFNEWSVDKGLEPLAKNYTVHAPGRTYHAARPIAALDRIAVTAGLAVGDAGVVQDKLTRRASDHLPIWADLAITSRKEPAK